MGVGAISKLMPNLIEDLSLKELLKGKKPEDLLEQSEVAAATAVAPIQSALASKIGLEPQKSSEQDSFNKSSGNSLMSGNFYSNTYEKSEYTKATLSGFAVERSYHDKMISLVESLQAQAAYLVTDKSSRGSSNPSGGVDYLMMLKAKRQAGQLARKEVNEASEDNLDEIRDDIDQAAQEAMAPKDAEGNSIPVLGADAAPVADAPAVPADAPVELPMDAPSVDLAAVTTPLGQGGGQVSIDRTV